MANWIVLFSPHVTELNAARMTSKLKCYLTFNERVHTGDFVMLIGGDSGLYAIGHVIKLNKTILENSNGMMSVEFSLSSMQDSLVSMDECRNDPEFQEILRVSTGNFPSFTPSLFNKFLSFIRSRGVDVPDNIPEFEESTDINGFRGIQAFHYELKKVVETFGLVSVLYMDLDNFKPVNDNYDYATGDLVIAETLKVVRTIIGVSGEVFRPHVTGDEMIGLLPNTNNSDSMRIAEAVRLALEQNVFSVIGQGHITVTVSSVTFPENFNEWETLEKAAERILKQAKKTKKNTVSNSALVAVGE